MGVVYVAAIVGVTMFASVVVYYSMYMTQTLSINVCFSIITLVQPSTLSTLTHLPLNRFVMLFNF